MGRRHSAATGAGLALAACGAARLHMPASHLQVVPPHCPCRDDGAATQENLGDLNGQFTLADHRPVQDIVMELMSEGYVPSWCTACYRKGRTGEHFMKIAKAGNIHNFCHPNSLFTLQEYLVRPGGLRCTHAACAGDPRCEQRVPVELAPLCLTRVLPPFAPLFARTTTAARRRSEWARS